MSTTKTQLPRLTQSTTPKSGYSYLTLAGKFGNRLTRSFLRKITPLLTSKCRFIINWKTINSNVFVSWLLSMTEKDISRSKISKETEKATKINPKFWLKCRDLKFKSCETKAELLSRHKFTVYQAFRLF